MNDEAIARDDNGGGDESLAGKPVSQAPGILEGVKVVDLTTVLSGPFPTKMLAEYGANVIKVESPDGDSVRRIGPGVHEQMGALFLQANAGKRSIVLDLKKDEARDILYEIIREADIFVHNMRTPAIIKLGLTYDDLRKIKSDIIYVGLYGFDQRGPYANKPAYDDLIQGLVGIPDLVARSGSSEPRYSPIAIADRYTGLSAFSAILGAYIHKLRTGIGQEVSVPMFETMAHLVLSDHLGERTFSETGGVGYARLLSPSRAPYRTRDGYVCLLVYSDKQWRNFFKALGKAEQFDSDARFRDIGTRTAHIDEIYAELAEILRSRSTDEWVTLLEAADLPVMPMHSVESLIDDPQLKAAGLISWEEHPTEGRFRILKVPSSWSQSQPEPKGHAPNFGQHTIEILRESGLNDIEISRLVATKAAIAGAPETQQARKFVTAGVHL